MSMLLVFLVLMVGMTYFGQRQQKKQADERQKQLNSLKQGDEIVTIGGLYAIVDEVDVDAQKITLDCDGVYLVYELSAVKRVVTAAGGSTNDVLTEEPSEETPTEAISGELVEE